MDAKQRREELCLFTDSYPYGATEPFLETELRYTAPRFNRVMIVPRRYGGSHKARPVPDNVTILQPVCERDSRLHLLCKGLFNTAPIRPMLRDLSAGRVLPGAGKLRKWTEATALARMMLTHRHIREINRLPDSGCILYFYWACGAAWVLPFLNSKKTAVARFHGFDLYEEEQGNNGYIPFRKALLERLDHGVFVSEHGRRYLTGKYGPVPRNAQVFRLGVEDAGRTILSNDGTLRIATCSRIVAIKRIDLIIEALKHLEGPVEWTHIGDGPLRNRTQALARELPANVTARFAGELANREVREFYRDSHVDLFLNLSETEGSPVSVMEALAAGIPVIATAAGGTPEMVDNKVGRLLPVSVSDRELAEAITGCAGSEEQRRSLSRNARQRWAERANAKPNYDAFGSFLADLAGNDEST